MELKHWVRIGFDGDNRYWKRSDGITATLPAYFTIDNVAQALSQIDHDTGFPTKTVSLTRDDLVKICQLTGNLVTQRCLFRAISDVKGVNLFEDGDQDT